MKPRLLHLQDPILSITVEVQPPTLCLSIAGELDLCCHQILEAAERMDLADVTNVLVDLKRMSFCDVAGFRALARLHDHQRSQHRTVSLVEPPRCFLRLVELTGRDDLLAAS